MILTKYGEVDRSLIVRDRLTLDNHNEKTLNLEYRLKAPLRLPDGRVVLPDEVIKRSAHVRLKKWPNGMDPYLIRAILGQPSASVGFNEQRRVSAALQRWIARNVRFANSQAMATSFKRDILNGLHALGTSVVGAGTTADTFKAALMLASGSLSATTTTYSNASELAGSGNYTQGGIAVTNATPPTTSGTTAYWTPSASVSWANLTSSASFDCMELYNDTSATDLTVAIFTFGAQSITAGTFTLTMPTNDSSNALIRIA